MSDDKKDQIWLTIKELEDKIATVVASILYTIRDQEFNIENIIDSDDHIESYAATFASEYIKMFDLKTEDTKLH